MFSVSDQHLSYDDIQYQENDHPMLSSSLNFLSHDQKLGLAERSSRASGHPGAFSQTGEEIIPRKAIMSQDAMLKHMQNTHQQNQSSIVDDDRKPSSYLIDDASHIPLSELETLDNFQEQMNAFQHNFELEIKSQNEVQLLQENERRKRLYWGICVVILLFVLIISLTIPLVMKSQTNQNDMPNNLESPFSIENCYTERYRDQNRFNNFRLIISSNYPNLTISIDEVGNNANLALCWISQYDTLNLTPNQSIADTLTQRFIMASLYFHFLDIQNDTNGGNIFSNQKWLSKKDVCDWNLVGCHDDMSNFRYVTILDFSEVRLKSKQLPSEIALLQNLTKLNFNPNVFEGTIPLELSSLTLLEEFRVVVSGSKSGYLVDKIIEPWNRLETLSLDLSFPSGLLDFGAITKLTYLELREQLPIYDHDFPDIQKLTELETLSFDFPFSSDLPSYLWRFSNLEELAFFSYYGPIPSDIAKLSNLKTLLISGQIPSEIGNLSQLEYLYIDTTFKVPSEIGRLSKLENIKISCSGVTGSQKLAKEICSLDAQFQVTGCYCTRGKN